jgi:hypothetical protein
MLQLDGALGMVLHAQLIAVCFADASQRYWPYALPAAWFVAEQVSRLGW